MAKSAERMDEIYILRWERAIVIFQALFTIYRSWTSFHVAALFYLYLSLATAIETLPFESKERITDGTEVETKHTLTHTVSVSQSAIDAPWAYEVRD